MKYLHSKAKCNLNMKNKDGWAPIHAAAQGGHIAIIEVGLTRWDNASHVNRIKSCHNCDCMYGIHIPTAPIQYTVNYLLHVCDEPACV